MRLVRSEIGDVAIRRAWHDPDSVPPEVIQNHKHTTLHTTHYTPWNIYWSTDLHYQKGIGSETNYHCSINFVPDFEEIIWNASKIVENGP